MNVMIVIVSFTVTVLIGFCHLVVRYRHEVHDKKYLDEYYKKIIHHIENDMSEETLAELIENMDRIQQKLGRAGIVDQYRAPFGSFTASNYQIAVNTIPKLRYNSAVVEGEVTMLIDAFSRAKGLMTLDKKTVINRLKNPLAWIAEGVSVIVSIPLVLLKEFGILGTHSYRRLTSSRPFKFIVGIISFVGALETISTLVLRKSAVAELVMLIIKFMQH